MNRVLTGIFLSQRKEEKEGLKTLQKKQLFNMFLTEYYQVD